MEVTPTSLRIDGVAVEIDNQAVLLRGPSGSGRSDLALRLIDEGARLISDEQVELCREGDRLLIGAPAAMPSELRGVIEARGVGLIAVPHVDRFMPLAWVIDMAAATNIERMPAAETAEYLGIKAPLLKLDPFAVSATAKLRLAVRSGPGHILGRE
jgi:serine kinase of HPr protein (carbohydrate metabolism regulator)